MGFPRIGQGAAMSRPKTVLAQPTWPKAGMPRDGGQTPTSQLNASIGPDRRLMGGGGMAVGPLRNQKGVGIHPKAARAALTSGMKG